MNVVDRLPESVPRPSIPRPDLPVAPGGLKYAALLAASAVPASLVLPFFGIPMLLGALFVLFFYRDPARHPPSSGYLSPADGTVNVVRYDEDGRIRVGIYLGVGDVHVVRSPVRGTVQSVRHEPGGHLPAFTKRSERNEKVHVSFDGTDVTMIAGAFARRITPYAEGGQAVGRGDRIGHIAFGSRTDVVLPEGIEPADLAVEPGEAVTAGESVLVSADAFDRDATPESAAATATVGDDGPREDEHGGSATDDGPDEASGTDGEGDGD